MKHSSFRMQEIKTSKKVWKPIGFDKQKMIDHAMWVFWKYGYEDTSIDMLENELHISRSSISHFFGNKEWLFRECIQRYQSLLQLRILSPLSDTETPPIKRIEDFFDSLYTIATEWESAYCGCLIMHHGWLPRKDDNYIDSIVSTYYHDLVDVLENVLSESVFTNKPPHAIELIVSITMTINNFSRTFPDKNILNTYKNTGKELVRSWV
jgi:AcrR family transcriptional regulator